MYKIVTTVMKLDFIDFFILTFKTRKKSKINK